MALAQDSFALRGYVDAIQLVMIASVPALKEEVVPNQPKLLEESESETEESFGDDPESVVETGAGDKPVAPPRFQLNPKNARDLNAECKIPVRSILDDPHEEWEKEHDFAWPDEKTDEIVDTLVKLVSECFKFKNEMFLGGLTFADIERLRGGGGGKQTVSTDEESPSPFANISIANLVAAQITSEIGGLESRIVKAIELEVAETIRVSGFASKVSSLESAVSSLQGIDGRLNMTITSSLKAIEETVMKAVSESYNKMLSIVLGGQQNTFVVPGGVQNPESHHPAPSKPTNNIGGADHAYTTDGAADAVRKVIADLDEVTAAAEGLGIEPNPQLHHNEYASQGDINQSTSSVDPLINITEHQDVEESDSEELPSSDNLVPPAVECPSFSIGLTQDGTSDNVVHAQPIEFVLPQELEAAIPAETRKSKRPKTAPAAYTDFKCDPKIVVQYSLLPELDTLFADVEKRVMAMGTVNLSEHISVSATEFLNIAFRRQHMPTKVMHALMGYLSSQLKSGDNKILICDTTLPAKLMRMHSRFVKTSVKERPKLKLFDEVFSTPTASTAEKIYFPFNIDQTHWVAVCVDRKNSSIHVLDCNVLLKTDSMMKKELNPIANMFPYVGNNSPSDSRNATYKPFSMSRSKGIPQYATPNDSAVMAVLLIDSHSSAGLDGCKAVTKRLLPGAAKQLAVKFFDFISGTD